MTITSNALASASNTVKSKYLGVTYASSTPTASVTIAGGSGPSQTNITAGGLFDMEALVTNTLEASTTVSSKGDYGDITFTYGKAVSDSTAELGSGVAVSADNADIDAKNTNDFTTESDAEDKNGTGTVGLSVTVTIGDYSSSATADVAGKVTTTGNTTVDAESINGTDKTSGSAAIEAKKQGDNSSDQGGLQGMLNKIPFVKDIGGKNAEAQSSPGANDPSSNEGTGVAITAAVVVVAGDNQASADLDPNSTVSAGGNVSVTSKAYDTIQASADGTAGDATKASVGGAVIVGNYTNQATSYVGSSATVDAAGTLLVNADAEILPQVANMFDTGFDTSATGISFTQTTSDISSVFDTGQTIVQRGEDAWNAVKTFLAAAKPESWATFYVHSGGTTSSGGTIGIAGGVNDATIDNEAHAYIDSGAQINTKNGTNSNQAVTVHAEADVATIDLVGMIDSVSNIPSFGQSSEGDAGVGGSFNLADYTNVADAYIGDSAKVNSGGDVSVTTNAEDLIVAVAQAGGKAQKVGVDGAFDFLDVNSTSQAYVGGTAKVDADGDVDIDAQTTMWVINVAGGIAQANNVGVGVGVGVTTVEDTTTAFIGDPGGGSGSGGTVTAGGNLDVQADSTQNVWTLTLAASKASGGGGSGSGGSGSTTTDDGGGSDPLDGQSLPNLFGEEPSGGGGSDTGTPEANSGDEDQSTGGRSFGVGVSGAVSINYVTLDTEAYIAAGTVTATDQLAVKSSNTTTMVAVDGGIAYSNNVAVAGSFQWNNLTQTVKAFLTNATATTGNAVVTAVAATTLIALAAGVGVSTDKSGVSVAGSVNLDMLSNSVEAYLGSGATLTTNTGGVDIEASNSLTTWTVAGVLSATKGSVSVGASLDLGLLSSTVYAYIGASDTVNSAGDVKVYASTYEPIHSIGACFSIATGSGGVAVGGSASSMNITHDIEAYIGNSATVTTPDSLRINAADQTWLMSIAGNVAGGKSVGVGVSAAVNTLTRTVEAYIGQDAVVSADGNGGGLSDPLGGTFGGNGVILDATTEQTNIIFAAGIAGSGDASVEASAAVTVFGVGSTPDQTLAYIGQGAEVNTDYASHGSTNQSVQSLAQYTLAVLDVAGSFAGSSGGMSAGAAVDVEFLPRHTEAYIAQGATVDAQGNVTVLAQDPESILSIAAGAAMSGGSVAIAGSASALTLNDTTWAYIGNDAVVLAEGSVAVTAYGDAGINTVAGQVSASGDVAAGASDSTVLQTVQTESWIGGGANVTAKDLRSAISVATGTKNSSGDEIYNTSFGGIAMEAVAYGKVLAVAAGGEGAGTVSVAGSAVVNVLNETTTATVDDGTTANPTSLDAQGGGDVNVLASDRTTLWGVAGAISGSGSVGIGIGADVENITKDTVATSARPTSPPAGM